MTATSESTVSLTGNAVTEVKLLQARAENTGKNLRLYIEEGGCSGMQYGMVFDERRDGDLISEENGVTVMVDAISANYLRGCTVDFSDSLTAGGFKILNPNAKHSCGCGKSFEA
jgi:iron-sulfur cluster assembly accessory protein